MSDEPGDERSDPSEEALDHVMERVRNVQDLEAFALTRRGDGRFTYELQKPLSDLTERESREAADALEELADHVRSGGGASPDEG